jgi:anti-sigma-K factor RskA
MTPHADIQGEIRRYLLGTLPEDAGRWVEERLMTEEAFLEELTLAEGELIDDYVGGRLADAERADFERHFLSNEERRRQLRFTRALSRYADAASATASELAGERRHAPTGAPTPGERLRAFWGGLSWATRGGLALATAAVIICAVWLARPPAPRTFVALTLVAGAGDRAGGVETPGVRLPLGADALKIALTLPEGATPAVSYRVEMLAGKGRPEAVEVTGHDGRSVSVVVPEARLARGRHVLRLFAVGADKSERRVGDSYVFDVE